MKTSSLISPVTDPGDSTYTPGHRTPKRLMLIAGVLLLIFGAIQLWTPLRLTIAGERATAEATRILKEKPGFPPVVITSDIALQSRLEPRDRSFIFWNEFEFTTAAGKTVTVHPHTGSQLKPLYPLTGPDGLPTTDLVCYDPATPEHAVFPLIISTWVAPSILFICGLACAVIGGSLLYWAGKPIELPHIANARPAPNDPHKS
jgi:hypothetical protein